MILAQLRSQWNNKLNSYWSRVFPDSSIWSELTRHPLHIKLSSPANVCTHPFEVHVQLVLNLPAKFNSIHFL